jgi:hypothetical protein
MAKRKKSPDDDFGNAVNRTEDLKQQIITDVDIFDTDGEPRVGVLVLDTPAGHYQFFVAEAVANEMIQTLRDFLAGDVDRLP